MNKTPEFSQNPEKEYSPEELKAIVQDVADETYKLFNVDEMANYDAIFEEKNLYLIIYGVKKKVIILGILYSMTF